MQRTRSAPRRCILRGSEPRGTIRPAVVAQARQRSEEESSGINTVTQCGWSYGDRKPSFFVTCRYPPRVLSIGSCQQCVHFRLLISERASVCACNIVLPCLPVVPKLVCRHSLALAAASEPGSPPSANVRPLLLCSMPIGGRMGLENRGFDAGAWCRE